MVAVGSVVELKVQDVLWLIRQLNFVFKIVSNTLLINKAFSSHIVGFNTSNKSLFYLLKIRG